MAHAKQQGTGHARTVMANGMQGQVCCWEEDANLTQQAAPSLLWGEAMQYAYQAAAAAAGVGALAQGTMVKQAHETPHPSKALSLTLNTA
jgi:hypothetical protein